MWTSIRGYRRRKRVPSRGSVSDSASSPVAFQLLRSRGAVSAVCWTLGDFMMGLLFLEVRVSYSETRLVSKSL